MDEPKRNRIQRKYLKDTPAGRYYEEKEKPGTGERYDPIQQKYRKDAGWSFDKQGAVKAAPAPEKIRTRRPEPTAVPAKAEAPRPRAVPAPPGEGRKTPAPLYGGTGDTSGKQTVGTKMPDSKPASVLFPAVSSTKREAGATSILRELWGDDETDYPERISRLLKKPPEDRLAAAVPRGQKTETVERLFPAGDRTRLPERRSEGIGDRPGPGKPFPRREEEPERAQGRRAIRPLRASGRLQHEDMPLDQFSGIVPYAGEETPEVPSVPVQPPESGRTGSGSDGSEIRYFDNNGQRVWADMSTLQGIGVLPDGTYINTTGDADADTLYEIIRAEAAGEISAEEAIWEKAKLARQIAVNEYPEDMEEQNELYRDRLVAFLNRDISYFTETPDVTERMEEIMKTAEKAMGDYIFQQYLMEGAATDNEVSFFRRMVTDHGPYDIKYWPEFQAHSFFIFDGEIVSRDALGNILYGYLGKSRDFFNLTLKAFAGINQFGKTRTHLGTIGSFFDDERDQQRIIQGIKIFHRTH